MNDTPDDLVSTLSNAALSMLIRMCPEIKRADRESMEIALSAMRKKAPAIMDDLMDDIREAPWVAKHTIANAALSLAEEGARAFKNRFSFVEAAGEGSVPRDPGR